MQLFGNCVDSLSAGLLYPENSAGAVQAGKRTHYSDVFSKAFSAGQQKLSDRLCNGRAWPLSEMTKNSLHADTKVVHEFLDPILTSAIERQRKTATGEEEKGSTGDEDTLLSYLVTQSSDYNLLRDELLNILIAGMLSHNRFTLILLTEGILIARDTVGFLRWMTLVFPQPQMPLDSFPGDFRLLFFFATPRNAQAFTS